MNTEKIAQEKLDRADITNLELLSYDIPELKTNEICTQNDFYYNAQVLKDYCNLKSDYQIKAALEHATYMGSDYYWEADVNHNLPAVIMQGTMRKAILEKVTNKEIFSIGTYIQYAKPFYDKEKFNKIKKELGKTLLVFPMHSTHWVNLEFNIKDFIDEIKRISKDFDTVMICMYWKDILKNAHSPYQKEGFKIVSAGHIYNKNFLPRLRTIIELSDLVCSNDVGSYVGQAIALNRPVYLYKQDYSFNSTNKEMDDGSEYDLRLKDKNYIDNFKVFSKYSLEITNEQREFTNYLWGVDIKLTPEEMIEYFKKLDIEYDKFLAENKRFKFIKKEKQGDKRKITILGFIKISYKKKQKKSFTLKMMEKEAFNPNFWGLFFNPFYITRKSLYKHISTFAKEFKYGNLLDVGCGTKPYKHLFQVEQYDGLEYWTEEYGSSKNADYIYDGHKFPFENNAYDYVISNEVLEHVFNPDEFLSEINRVLKKNGKMLITVPFVWDEHEQPYDFGRYSSFGLKHMLETHGFKILRAEKSVSDISLIFQLLNAYIYKIFIGKGKVSNLIIINSICSIFNVLAVILTKITPKNNDLFLDNIVLAEKIEND